MLFPTKQYLLRMFTWNVWLPAFNSERNSSNFDPSMTPKLRSWKKNLCSIHSTMVVQSGCRTVFVEFAYLHSDIIQQHVTFPCCIYLFTDVHKWYLNGFTNEQRNFFNMYKVQKLAQTCFLYCIYTVSIIILYCILRSSWCEAMRPWGTALWLSPETGAPRFTVEKKAPLVGGIPGFHQQTSGFSMIFYCKWRFELWVR